jgi:hypothetical protein
MHANVVGTSGLRLDRFGVDVLEELKATVTVWRLEHRNVGVIAIKADGGVGPLTTDRVTADDREAEVGEKGDRCFEIANGDADVLKFDGRALHATEPGELDLHDVTLVGESLRAVLALTTAADLPERVRRVVAVNAYDYRDGTARSSALARVVIGGIIAPGWAR